MESLFTLLGVGIGAGISLVIAFINNRNTMKVNEVSNVENRKKIVYEMILKKELEFCDRIDILINKFSNNIDKFFYFKIEDEEYGDIKKELKEYSENKEETNIRVEIYEKLKEKNPNGDLDKIVKNIKQLNTVYEKLSEVINRRETSQKELLFLQKTVSLYELAYEISNLITTYIPYLPKEVSLKNACFSKDIFSFLELIDENAKSYLSGTEEIYANEFTEKIKQSYNDMVLNFQEFRKKRFEDLYN